MLYLVRHALTRPDPHRLMHEWELDPRGAEDLARLAGLPCFAGARRIVSSTEGKAVLTAEAIRARHGLPPVAQYPDLCELRKGGWVENHDAVMAALFANPAVPVLPGWETADAAVERFSACAERLLAEDGDLVLVSHATVLSLYLARLQGERTVRFDDWRSVRFPDYAVIDSHRMAILSPFGRSW